MQTSTSERLEQVIDTLISNEAKQRIPRGKERYFDTFFNLVEHYRPLAAGSEKPHVLVTFYFWLAKAYPKEITPVAVTALDQLLTMIKEYASVHFDQVTHTLKLSDYPLDQLSLGSSRVLNTFLGLPAGATISWQHLTELMKQDVVHYEDVHVAVGLVNAFNQELSILDLNAHDGSTSAKILQIRPALSEKGTPDQNLVLSSDFPIIHTTSDEHILKDVSEIPFKQQ